MAHITVKVPPLSRKRIRETAEDFRRELCWNQPFFPIVEVMDIVLSRLDDDYLFLTGFMHEMGDEHGRTFPDEKTILIREDVYEGACNGNGRDRMTMAHELGHLFLHYGLPLSRRVDRESIPAYRSSEWQANCFGGELLIPSEYIKQCSDIYDASELFGVSVEAAEMQWRVYKKEKIIS